MKILGISSYYHDSAAAIIDNGRIIAAVQEERFSRIKNDSGFPRQAAQYCLKAANSSIEDIDAIVFYDKPFLKFERLLETYVTTAPKGFKSFAMSMPVWLTEKLFQKKLLIKSLAELSKSDAEDKTVQSLVEDKLYFSTHHQSHAASAYYPSGFDEAIILTMDGVGEWATTTVSIGRGHELIPEKEIHFPHSLGLLYSAFTYYTGFRVNSGEYKLMGLAPYGKPRYTDLIYQELIDIKDDGSFRLNQRYFNYMTGLTMVNKRFEKLFGRPSRKPDEEPIDIFHMDIAASVQKVLEDIVMRMVSSLANEYKIPNLCLAGGVALNCVANGEILRSQLFERIWVQPAAGDAGGALGAALAYWHDELGKPLTDLPEQCHDHMHGAYLGPAFTDDEVLNALDQASLSYSSFKGEQLFDTVAQYIEQGNVVGWFQGRSEFGPRALGNRSILGDPRSASMQKQLNLKIKYRESFRPFAPAVLKEDMEQWFACDAHSPYMQFVMNIAQQQQLDVDEGDLEGIDQLALIRSSIPAVTHVDYSARLQTVDGTHNPDFYQLIQAFKKKTGCPILINTSFNVRGEPIVNSPEDAIRCFLGTEMDVLVLGQFVIQKSQQSLAKTDHYKQVFPTD